MQARAEYVRLKWGVTPGVRVIHKGITFSVDSIRPTSFEREDRKPWLHASRIMANGEACKLPQCIYDEWEVKAS